MPEFYKWTVEFSVHKDWVADGFDLTDDRALDMLSADLSYAHVDNELRAKVIRAPKREAILTEQGYTGDRLTAELDRANSSADAA